MSDNQTTRRSAIFYKDEIELLVNRALWARDPLVVRRWRFTRRRRRLAASEDALYRFHEIAAEALHRFDQEVELTGGR